MQDRATYLANLCSWKESRHQLVLESVPVFVTTYIEENFVQLCDASHHRLGNILSPDGSVAAYKDDYCQIIFEGASFDSTVRSSKCSLVVSGVSKCDYCRKYRSVLRAMHSHQKKCS